MTQPTLPVTDYSDLYYHAMHSSFIPMELDEFQALMDTGYLSISRITDVWIDARISEKFILAFSETPDADIEDLNAMGVSTLQQEMSDTANGCPLLEGMEIRTIEPAGNQFLVEFWNGDTGIYPADTMTTYRKNTHEVGILREDYESWILPAHPRAR